jgi:hypothetical protein
MPTKRRPLKHAPRIGEVRVTARLLDLYRQFQSEAREHGGSVRAAQLQHAMHGALKHLPWGSMQEQRRDYDELHKLAYEDPRPQRLDVIGRAVYNREHERSG